MFGMGFTEILFVAVIAIIFLGPDKLPEAMVQIAKFFNNLKKTVNDAKSTFENEININDLKKEALSYKKTMDSDITGFKNSISRPIDDLNEALSDLENDIKPSDDYKTSQQRSTVDDYKTSQQRSAIIENKIEEKKIKPKKKTKKGSKNKIEKQAKVKKSNSAKNEKENNL